VGLVAHTIEKAGITTVCLSNIPDLTQSVGVSRLVGIEYPLSRTLGKPGDAEDQRAVLRATLAAAEEMESPGEVRHLPFKWHETPAQARAGHTEPSPIEAYLKKHPWHLPRLLSREIPPSMRW
jgi:hypothetical protein